MEYKPEVAKAWRGPRGFYTNAGLQVKSTARFREIVQFRRQKCGANFFFPRKVESSFLALRAYTG